MRLIFILSIFLPTLAVYIHEFSNHEHQDCQESTVHFHKFEEDCSLDNFISNKVYSLSANNYKSLIFLFNSVIFEIEAINKYEYLLNFFKRGPPLN